MGDPKNVVSTYFHAKEDATRKSVAVKPDAKGRTDRPLPRSIEGDPGLVDFHRSHTGSKIDGKNNLERSLRRLGDLCPEIKRLSKAGSSAKGIRIKKEEEEDVALTSKGKQEKRKKDLSKVKCFNCEELGHYASQCPRKKSKGEAFETKAAPIRAEKELETDDDCAMSAHTPLERK